MTELEERAAAQEAAEKVARGARLLDRKKPGWHREINELRLNVNDCVWDAVGQVFGSYNLGLRALGIPDWLEIERVYYGLEPSRMSHREIERLNFAWRQEISRRFGSEHRGGRRHAAA